MDRRGDRAGAAAVVLAGLLVAGCSLRVSTGGLDTLATTVTTRPPVLTVASTTVPPATVDDSLPDVPVQLSPDGPWRRVDGAPGIDTAGLFYELMPQLYVYLPIEEDLDHGITWTLGEDDVPIIEAYLQARLVYFRSVSVDPIELDDPGWALWYTDGGAAYRDWLAGKRQRGEYVDLADGVVLRPTVAGDEKTATTALVMDCMLDGGVFLQSDGSLAEGSSWGVGEVGRGARLTMVDGRWMVRQIGETEAACIG
ncbi:MAG: hypothetical protein ACO3C1_09580 [Ilumatobacteraceae bacterium]